MHAIEVRSVSKSFRIGEARQRHNTLRDVLAALPRAALQGARRFGRRAAAEEFWALRDISFDVKAGEVLGVIGRNGAGKSTLLKILSRITEPTAGEIILRGRVGSLLEVGTGFHTELTGRENIFLSGAILGMREGEITRKFDEIVEFAEVERFIDTPVKHYSSGMYLRLAFAVAAYLEPEILLVDEVLAVGDAQFQRKCLGKMRDVAQHGRTVLFVSHNTSAVERLCQRAIWLEGGKLVGDGRPTDVIGTYLRTVQSVIVERYWEDGLSSTGGAWLCCAILRPAGGTGGQVDVASPLRIEIEYANDRADACLNVSLHFLTEDGVIAFASSSIRGDALGGREHPVGRFRSTCEVPAHLLNAGTYRVEALLVRDQNVVLQREEEALVFEVNDVPHINDRWHGRWPGAVRPALPWVTERVTGRAAMVDVGGGG
jgi:lipopolysaccharide transport system ATP-binding protein